MLVDTLVGVFAPYNCLVCGREGALVCKHCLPVLASTKRSSCFLCNKLTKGWQTCPTCRRHTSMRGVYIGSHYESQVKQLLRMLKYERAVASATVLARMLAPTIEAQKFSLVTAIPSTSGRYRQRGYNQAALIAHRLARNCKLPYAECLARLGQSRQVGTDRKTRLTQAEGTMYCKKLSRVYGKQILVVDDVVTTGATMKEAARALKLAGAKACWGAAIAKH